MSRVLCPRVVVAEHCYMLFIGQAIIIKLTKKMRRRVQRWRDSRGFLYISLIRGGQHFSINRSLQLKVPKREIFNRSDFSDFYTIKSLRVGDFRVKIKKIFKKIQGFFQGCKVPYAYAQSIFQEVFFLSFGPKFFFSVALLRPLVSVNNDFLKF